MTVVRISEDWLNRIASDYQGLLAVVKAAAEAAKKNGQTFGQKIFLWPIFDALAAKGVDRATASFFLLQTLRRGDTILARADMPCIHPPGWVTRSEILSMGASFHFILDGQGILS